MRLRERAGHETGNRPCQDADQDRPDRIEVDRDLERAGDGLAEHDVDGDGDRDEHDRPGIEPAPAHGMSLLSPRWQPTGCTSARLTGPGHRAPVPGATRAPVSAVRRDAAAHRTRRACSTMEQRSMTTERPPSCAIRAASTLTIPSWSQRHRAPAATASAACGGHSSARRNTSTRSTGPSAATASASVG